VKLSKLGRKFRDKVPDDKAYLNSTKIIGKLLTAEEAYHPGDVGSS
jgi:hypothetical protein